MIEEDDLPWFWAAYKKGAFENTVIDNPDVEFTPPGLAERVLSILGHIYSSGGEVFLLWAPTEHGRSPVGVVSVEYVQDAAWPHVIWFPWASPRNRLECALRFLVDMKKDLSVIVRTEEDRLYKRLSQYGVLRLIGESKSLQTTLYEGVNWN